MKSLILIVAMFAVPFAAQAQDEPQQNVVVKCRGYAGQLSIYFQSDVPVKYPDQAVSSLEVGLVVKKWAPSQTWDYASTETKGKTVELEGALAAGAGDYKFVVPWIEDDGMGGTMSGDRQYNIATKSFTTSLTLKTAVYSGNLSVSCDTTLRTVKSKSEMK
jgi:hypothetical protein